MNASIQHTLVTLALAIGLASFAEANSQELNSSIGDGQTPSSYRIRVNDSVAISVFKEPELGVSQRIDGDGLIKLPLLGETSIVGMTTREAEAFLEQKFIDERYLREPAVTVSVVQYAPRQIIILGEVGRPGPLELPLEEDSLDIVELIARAGGFSGIAKQDSVRIKRERSNGTVREFVINVEDLISGRQDGERRGGFEVVPGDLVYVPERLF